MILPYVQIRACKSKQEMQTICIFTLSWWTTFAWFLFYSSKNLNLFCSNTPNCISLVLVIFLFVCLFVPVIQRTFSKITLIGYQTIALILPCFRNVISKSNQKDSLKKAHDDLYVLTEYETWRAVLFFHQWKCWLGISLIDHKRFTPSILGRYFLSKLSIRRRVLMHVFRC